VSIGDQPGKSASGLSKEHRDRQLGVGRFAGLGIFPLTFGFYL
jgi:hypothetical protein